jgi:stromal membrane-associated protein
VGDINVKVVKGTNLAVRDIRSSDPYVVLYLGQQVICLFHMYNLFLVLLLD